jgi:phosphate starvation-inducible PhoH-like protein
MMKIIPKTPNQVLYKRLLDNKHQPVILATGPAGTGKTLMACYTGAAKLALGEYKRIVMTRPAVSVDEQHGFLPGELERKMEPWTRPMFDSLRKYYSQREIDLLTKDKSIEICPLAYMRGRTFDQSWIIADEMQNATPNQMQMVLTRIGYDSKMIVAGDPDQYDKGFQLNGISDLTRRIGIHDSDVIRQVYFTEADQMRNPVINDILRLFDAK